VSERAARDMQAGRVLVAGNVVDGVVISVCANMQLLPALMLASLAKWDFLYKISQHPRQNRISCASVEGTLRIASDHISE
jgi:hypothetical protein